DVVAPTGTAKGVRTEQNLGSTQVTTDGIRWTEVDAKPTAQPVAVFAGMVGYSAPVNLWPPLPASPAPGTGVSWKVPAQQAMGGTMLGLFGGGKQPSQVVDSASIQLAKWVKVGGDLACVLEGTWDKEQATDEKMGNQKVIKRATLRGAARFVV